MSQNRYEVVISSSSEPVIISAEAFDVDDGILVFHSNVGGEMQRVAAFSSWVYLAMLTDDAK